VSTRLWLSLVMLVMGGGLLTATGLAGPGQQRGGTLRIARSSDIGSLDPALAYTPDTSAIEFAICAKLHSYPDKPGREGAIVIPEVAEGFPTVSRTEGRRRSSSSAAAASRVVWTIGVGPEACRIAIERGGVSIKPVGNRTTPTSTGRATPRDRAHRPPERRGPRRGLGRPRRRADAQRPRRRPLSSTRARSTSSRRASAAISNQPAIGSADIAAACKK
jgi:hypothetical protein